MRCNEVELEKKVNYEFKKKYKTNKTTYNKSIVTHIIFNEKTRLVALFKDFLILDDGSEFLRRFYVKSENKSRLSKIISFYETYSKIFPNYIILPESKYLYKNIRRKQKIIDAFKQINVEDEENRYKFELNKNKKKEKVFDSDIKQSILRYQASNYHLNSSVLSRDNSINNSISILLNNEENENSFISINNILNAISNKVHIENKVVENKIETKKYSNIEKDSIKTEEIIQNILDAQSKGNPARKKLRTILSDNLKILTEGCKIGKMNQIKTVNVHNSINSMNKNNCNNCKQEIFLIPQNNFMKTGYNEKPMIKQVLKKRLSMNDNTTKFINDTNNISMQSPLITPLVTSPKVISNKSEEKKKISSHRVSSSITEKLNCVKIINNYPNIIIPSGSTHVSINQNYYNYNYGNNQTPITPSANKIILIEHFKTIEQIEYEDSQHDDHKIEKNFKDDPEKIYREKKTSVDVNKTIIDKFEKLKKSLSPNFKKNSKLMKEFSPVNNKSGKMLEKEIKILYSQSIKNDRTNSRSICSKKPKKNQENTKSKGGLAKSIGKSVTDNNKINFENKTKTYNIKTNAVFNKVNCINIGTLNKNSNLKNRVNSTTRRNFKSNKYTLETDRQTDRHNKSKVEVKEILTSFIDKSKVECFTARNSVEKILVGECHKNCDQPINLKKSIITKGIDIKRNLSNINNLKISNFIKKYANKQYEMNNKMCKIYLSPEPNTNEKIIERVSNSNLNYKKENSNANIYNININNPLRFPNKTKVLNGSSAERKLNPLISAKGEKVEKVVNKMKNSNRTSKDSNKCVSNISNNFNTIDSQFKNTFRSKVNFHRGGGKSLDFQVLNNFRK